MSVFVHAQGIKTVHAGVWGVKNWQNYVHVVVEWHLYIFLKLTLEKTRQSKGPYFNYVSMFSSIFDQLSTLVSIFTTVTDNSYSTVVSILQTKYSKVSIISP